MEQLPSELPSGLEVRITPRREEKATFSRSSCRAVDLHVIFLRRCRQVEANYEGEECVVSMNP